MCVCVCMRVRVCVKGEKGGEMGLEDIRILNEINGDRLNLRENVICSRIRERERDY